MKLKLNVLTKSFDETNSFWQMKYNLKGDKLKDVGEIILPQSIMNDRSKISIAAIENGLNHHLEMDRTFEFQENTQLMLFITYKDGSGTIMGFEFKNGLWESKKWKLADW